MKNNKKIEYVCFYRHCSVIKYKCQRCFYMFYDIERVLEYGRPIKVKCFSCGQEYDKSHLVQNKNLPLGGDYKGERNCSKLRKH